MSALTSTHDQNLQLAPLLGSLGELIRQARQKALRAVDTLQVQTCWQIGRHIIEFEQEGAERAAYGKRLLPTLAKLLTEEFGKGFDERNLRHMRDFYRTFPIWNAVRTELSWTHYRTLLRVENNNARQWYMHETATLNWSTRALERQIATLYYERLLASMEKTTLFMSNRNQTVRLPKAVAMPEGVKRIDVAAIGRARIITPAGEAWGSWFDGESVCCDFMADREQPLDG
jgi:virulence-associated protein VagC